MRRKILIGLIGIILLYLFFWLSGHSYVEISVPTQNSNKEITYKLLNQASQKSQETKTSSSSIKKLIPRGNYEVWVSGEGGSYFSITKTGRFLATTSVNAKLQPEKSRQFVGDNPGPCMFYLEGRLVSYACGDLSTNLNIHMPANASQPTYVLKNQHADLAYGSVQGTVQTREGTLALVQPPADNETGDGYSLYRLNGSLVASNRVGLAALDKSKPYNITAYKDSFLVFDENLGQVLYYSSSTAKPAVVKVDKPSDQSLVLLDTKTKDTFVVTTYGNKNEAKKQKQKAEVVLSDGTTSKHFSFSKNYFSATVCGTNKLCALASKNLDVYDIAGQKPALLYSLTNVATNMVNTDTGLLLINAQAVLNFNVDEREGFAEYTFGGYTFNNIVTLGGNNGYVLSLTNNKGRRVALLINQGSADSGAIDKKVLELEKLSEVSSLSIYENYIFISPNVSSLVYNNALKAFDYDPVQKKAANDKINQKIKELGIDTNKYIIVNTKK